MTSARSSSKSEIFLMELIIAIVFFAISSAVCTQLFVKAHMLSAKSSDLNAAMIQAQNAAEVFKASQGSVEKLVDILKPAQGEEAGEGDNMYELFFDSAWKRVGRIEDAAYRLQLELTSERALQSADIQIYTNKRTVTGQYSGEQIYQLTAKSYNG